MDLRTLFYSTALSAVLLGSAQGPVQAAPATTDQAQQLTTLFQRYLGKPAEGRKASVTVTPEGETYKVEVDLGQLMSPLVALGLKDLTAGDYIAILTPQDDGTWHVTSDGLPPVGASIDDKSFAFTYTDFKFDGIFDPKLGVFKSLSSSHSGATVVSNSPKMSNETHMTGHFDDKGTAVDAGNGTVNIKTNQTVGDLAYNAHITGPAATPDAKPVDLVVSAQAPVVTGELSLNNAHATKIFDLWAYFVAHHTKEEIAAHQPELKTLLTAALPYASSLNAIAEIQKLAVNTPAGQFGAADFSEHIDLGGDKARDGVGLGIKLDGLTLPATLAPAWAAGLVPTGFDIDAKLSPVHPTDALLKLVGNADFSADRPLTDEQLTDAGQTFAALQDLNLTVASSTITTPLMSVKAEGQMQFTQPLPTGTAAISAVGLDKALNALHQGAQSDTNVAQTLIFLTAMKALGNAEGPDTYSWRIEAKPGSDVTVNGKALPTATASETPAEPAAPAKPAKKKKPSIKTAP